MLGRDLFGGDSIGRDGTRSAKPASTGSCCSTNAAPEATNLAARVSGASEPSDSISGLLEAILTILLGSKLPEPRIVRWDLSEGSLQTESGRRCGSTLSSGYWPSPWGTINGKVCGAYAIGGSATLAQVSDGSIRTSGYPWTWGLKTRGLLGPSYASCGSSSKEFLI